LLIVIPQRALSVKLEIAKKILCVAVIACSLYGNAYFYRLPIGYIFGNRHHIEVGAIPDDYRTSHPISLAEQDEHLDVLVGAGDKHISLAQKSVIQGFVAQYISNGSGPVQVMWGVGAWRMAG